MRNVVNGTHNLCFIILYESEKKSLVAGWVRTVCTRMLSPVVCNIWFDRLITRYRI